MTPTDYEKAVLQQIRTDWPPPRFVVRHNIRISGKKSKARRQIDIGVFEAGHSKPFMIVEAKRHKRPIDVGKAGSAIALVQDVGGIPAVMVSTSGFSVAAGNHLGAEGIGTMTIDGFHWSKKNSPWTASFGASPAILLRPYGMAMPPPSLTLISPTKSGSLLSRSGDLFFQSPRPEF
jgi:hypothetical protein